MRAWIRNTCLVLSLGAPALSQTLPDGPGRKELETLCGACHGPEAVLGVEGMDRDGWQQKVFQMIGPGTAAEQPAIKALLDYLVANMGPLDKKPSPAAKLNVNEATAKELQSVLSLDPVTAEAVVKYRQTNGRFRDLADFQKALTTIVSRMVEDKKQILSF